MKKHFKMDMSKHPHTLIINARIIWILNAADNISRFNNVALFHLWINVNISYAYPFLLLRDLLNIENFRSNRNNTPTTFCVFNKKYLPM